MPSPRRQRTFSPRKRIANSTVIGAPLRLTTPAADGLAVSRPMNSSAKDPPLMARPMTRTCHSLAGRGRSSGISTAATMMERTRA